MKDLFLPSYDRSSVRLEDVLKPLVHDVARIDPDSRHYHLYNSLLGMTERLRAQMRRADPRPWNGDVRQTGAVEAAQSTDREVGDEDAILYGIPSDIETRRLRSYTQPSMIADHSGDIVSPVDVRAVEANDQLIVQANNRLHGLDENGQLTDIPRAQKSRFHLASTEPGQYTKLPAPGSSEDQVATQVDGLDITFAGRGTFELGITFTGVVSVQDGSDLTNAPNMEEPLKLYDEEGAATYYTVTDDAIKIADAGPDQSYTLYYRGFLERTHHARTSVRVDETPEHRVSMAEIAEYLNDIPTSDKIECRQVSDFIAELPVAGKPVTATADGYVGGTHVGHPIHHVMPGTYHALALGDGILSVVEVESTNNHKFRVADDAVGVTWTREGLLGLVVAEGSEFVVYGLNEIRRGKSSGFRAKPIMDD